ncbi:MAG: TetR family transcriptional regulator [Acidimicrobiales bacterium]|nr:TetR family transcriptional regulator [Acidimicrobiales bacterium]
MTGRAKAHRASALKRRSALLEAAAELSAEVGAGAVTHRAVAARAGVPLSTTSYFFASIDDLVTEALQMGAARHVADCDEAEDAAVEAAEVPVDEVIQVAVDRALESSRAAEGSQVEYYLAAGRDPRLRPDATASVARTAQRVAAPLRSCAAPQCEDAAWTMGAFADGAMLHRLAAIDVDHRYKLRRGLRLLAAAAMLSDAEVEGLLARYDSEATTSPPAERATAPLAD